MTIQAFRAKAYEILTKDGYLEIDGKLYYPDESVIKMLEWIYENAETIPEVEDVMGKVLTRIKNAFGPTT